MTFHRTPAEMAADASFERSPIGESLSGHRLWLMPEDFDKLGPEPIATGKVDHDDPAAVAAERARAKLWTEWWSRACRLFDKRQAEARSDPVWLAEYTALLELRRQAAPAERAATKARHEEFEARHPQRGLTPEEEAASSLNWKRRSELTRRYGTVMRANPRDPLLKEISADIKECDHINDGYITLKWSRPSYDAECASQAEAA